MNALEMYEFYTTERKLEPDVAASLVIAVGLNEIARALRDLGNADAGTSMGAIEAFGKQFKESLELLGTEITDALQSRSETT